MDAEHLLLITAFFLFRGFEGHAFWRLSSSTSVAGSRRGVGIKLRAQWRPQDPNAAPSCPTDLDR